MNTLKEYGLILKNNVVKIVEVIVNTDEYNSFCTANISEELNIELNSFLKKAGINSIAIIPNTALYSSGKTMTKLRDATDYEAQEYLFRYEDNLNNI